MERDRRPCVSGRAAGFQESDAPTVTVITSVTSIDGRIVVILLVDRVGRRPVLLAFLGAVGSA